MGNLGHHCTGCGGSCQGVKVRLVDEDTANRIRHYGAQLGVADPVDDGRLRQTEDGQCAFLDDRNACQIHRRFGAAAKPRICRQYPLVLLRTESGVRTGIDPGCYSAFVTRNSPDRAVDETALWSESHYDSPTLRMESALSALLTHPKRRIDQSLRSLAGLPGEGLPTGFEERLIARLADPSIAMACRHPSAGPSVRSGLETLVDALPRWLEEGPPGDVLPSERETWGLEVAHRMVWLRLCPRMPSPMVAALTSLCGTYVAHWTDLEGGAPFAHTLAAWSRAMRSPAFWGRLFPDPKALSTLLRGEASPPSPN